MSSPSLRDGSGESRAVPDAKGRDGPSRSSGVQVTVIVQNRYTFETQVVTGKQIKVRADVPEGFALYRRVRGGNEPISDDAHVELRSGDHFFARPSPSAS
jgi:hypothetical protein